MPISGDYNYELLGDSNATITGYTGVGGDITIPTTLDGYTVTSIGEHAFDNHTSLTRVIIPSSVTSIGYAMFASCTSLTSVTIPSSVTSIGNYTFLYCTSLISIVVDNGNSTYSSLEGVLYNKLQTTLICYPAGKTGVFTVPNSVTIVDYYAFSSCNSLISVTIPNSVTSIGEYAFASCISLTSVIIPNNVTRVGDRAFDSCTSLIAAKFFGDAPTMSLDVFIGVSGNFKIYYLYEKSGFPNPLYGHPTEPFYMVTYDGNGNTFGTSPLDSDTTITVSDNTGSLKKVGYAYGGWNTQADGTGTYYNPGATFGVVSQNVILYAQWKLSQLLISSTLITTVLT